MSYHMSNYCGIKLNSKGRADKIPLVKMQMVYICWLGDSHFDVIVLPALLHLFLQLLVNAGSEGEKEREKRKRERYIRKDPSGPNLSNNK